MVLFNVALALSAVVLVIWLAGRPGLHWRMDLTRDQANTIDGQLARTIDSLTGQLTIEAFLRPFDPPLEAVGGELQARIFELLLQAEEHAPRTLKFIHHPYLPPEAGGTELLARMTEVGVRGSFNTIVLSYEEPGEEGSPRRNVLNLLGEVAEVDLGNPFKHQGNYRPPSIVSYRGQEALLRGILKVTQGEKPLAVFAQGNGERALLEADDRALGRLHTALLADGFRVEAWDPDADRALPQETAVLALCGPEEPFRPETMELMADFVLGGGSLVAAPGLEFADGPGSVTELLTRFGVEVQPGIICRPFMGASGLPTVGTPRVAEIVVRAENMSSHHPIVAPLRRGDRRVRMIFSRPLGRGRPPTGGVLIDLLRSSNSTWRDLPNADGTFAWLWDEEQEESGPFSLAMTSVFPIKRQGPAPPPGTLAERPECRVLAIASPEVFGSALFDTNRDFLVNAFNWAASREFRVSITPRTADDTRIDIGSDRSLFYISLFCIALLPLGFAALGLVVFLRRRS
jgi:hypothetical protein